MNEIKIELSHLSVSCNRYSHCIDWKNRLICFAAKQSIAIYCVQVLIIIITN
jgi:hypothetical protein